MIDEALHLALWLRETKPLFRRILEEQSYLNSLSMCGNDLKY